MQELTTIQFTDIESNDEGCVIIRYSKDTLGLCLSLQHDGDIEVFMNVSDGKRLLKALQSVISLAEQA